MAKKRNKDKQKTYFESLGFHFFNSEKTKFILSILLFVVAIYLIIAFVSYFSTGGEDQSLVLAPQEGELQNASRSFQNICGSIGAYVSHFFISRCFGISAFLIPVFMIMCSLKLSGTYKNINLLKWFFGLTLTMVWCSVAFAKLFTPIFGESVFNPGGDHGMYCAQWIENIIGSPGLIALLVVVALAFLTYLSSETINVVRNILDPMRIVRKIPFTITNNQSQKEDYLTHVEPDPDTFEDPEEQTVRFTDNGIVVGNGDDESETAGSSSRKRGRQQGNGEPGMTVAVGADEEKAHGKVMTLDDDLSTPINPKEPFTRYKYPTLSLLDKSSDDSKHYIDEAEQMANKKRIVEVLNSYGVQISEIRATVGPTITLYEIVPAEGVRIKRIKNLEDDIALSLAALGIRIIAPIPGKGTIGIEVPNAKPKIVSMESILNSKKFQETTMELPIALGKTITNEVYMLDLAKIPHLLVAGATGQGKSVGLNAIIASLLYKKHPNELKFVLIDPKKVEFSVYSPIADHFMASVDFDEEPIITDVQKVVRTLKSLCTLMDHRYDMLKLAGTRNIKEYNRKYVNHQLNLSAGHEYMPYIVVIIDEFGDLIMTAGKEIELPIARIAQLARAVGIHMIIATQRPTTNIITGTIKANFPGRMAFKVSAMIDSRTILDRPGANQLVGRGDMLILNGSEPVRVQCAFIDTPEVERIAQYIEEQPGPVEPLQLPEPAVEESEVAFGEDGEVMVSGADSLFVKAAKLIVATQQGSTSMLQRKFEIGYNRAGRLMDDLEKHGIVGAQRGAKPREVLIQDEASLDALLASMNNG
ncbi:MAG: DNA translocase FtsK 4TM domain-containing protein [Prevotella sp.]|nr:DNA translocase FtsK 4TM domain-containing protein [Prevotella sp.]